MISVSFYVLNLNVSTSNQDTKSLLEITIEIRFFQIAEESRDRPEEV